MLTYRTYVHVEELKMENNITTIYLDPSALECIARDQKLFKLDKNQSALIKKIIINHYKQFDININELKDKIRATIEYEGGSKYFDEEKYLNVAWEITKHITEKTIVNEHGKKKRKKKISIRQNNNDSKLELILNACPENAGHSEYLANIIYSYLKEPQNEREKIIFKDVINTINTAIHNNQCIRIKTKTNDKIRLVSPKEIRVSEEELYNYFLYQVYSETSQKYFASTIHIYNIIDCYPEAKFRTFEPIIEERFNRMKNNGVQFSINDETVYKVKLTEEGKSLFNSRYLERPVPLSESDVEKGVYYFDCSKMQLKSYFAPFFKEAVILEPKEMVDEIKKDYQESIKNYQ